MQPQSVRYRISNITFPTPDHIIEQNLFWSGRIMSYCHKPDSYIKSLNSHYDRSNKKLGLWPRWIPLLPLLIIYDRSAAWKFKRFFVCWLSSIKTLLQRVRCSLSQSLHASFQTDFHWPAGAERIPEPAACWHPLASNVAVCIHHANSYETFYSSMHMILEKSPFWIGSTQWRHRASLLAIWKETPETPKLALQNEPFGRAAELEAASGSTPRGQNTCPESSTWRLWASKILFTTAISWEASADKRGCSARTGAAIFVSLSELELEPSELISSSCLLQVLSELWSSTPISNSSSSFGTFVFSGSSSAQSGPCPEPAAWAAGCSSCFWFLRFGWAAAFCWSFCLLRHFLTAGFRPKGNFLFFWTGLGLSTNNGRGPATLVVFTSTSGENGWISKLWITNEMPVSTSASGSLTSDSRSWNIWLLVQNTGCWDSCSKMLRTRLLPACTLLHGKPFAKTCICGFFMA